MASPERQELIRNAVTFLRDPQSQASPLTQKVQFLEAKGLTPDEIQDAMRQATPPAPSGSQYRRAYSPVYDPSIYSALVQPPRQQPDWRDYFIIAVVSGSFMYGAVTLARKYLMPHLRPPSSTAYEGDRDALSAQFDAAEALLKEIQSETGAVRKAVEEQQQKVEQVTEDVASAVKEMREGEAKSRDELREIREEINSIRDLLPKMMDKNKESQSQSLAELQQELKSLKALLLSRGSGFTPASPSLPAFVGRPSIPAWQLAGASPSGASQSGVHSDPSASAPRPTTPLSSPVATHPEVSLVGNSTASPHAAPAPSS